MLQQECAAAPVSLDHNLEVGLSASEDERRGVRPICGPFLCRAFSEHRFESVGCERR
jgi:hypothetical protein